MAKIYACNGEEVLVDDEDFEVVSKMKWHLTKEGYVVTTLPRRHGHKPLCMHRIVITPPDGMVIDHINGNPRDNRKENLRFADHSQNAQNQRKSRRNTSGLKGVSWDKGRGKWLAQISVHGKRLNLGRYNTPGDAYSAYCASASDLHREFANYG